MTNGWRNRETWLVNLWFEPQTKEDIEYLKDNIKDEFESFIEDFHSSGFIKDMICFQCIDWQQLSDAMEGEE